MRVHSINFLMMKLFEKIHVSILYTGSLVQKLHVDSLAVWGRKGISLEVSGIESIVMCNQKCRESCGLFYSAQKALRKALVGEKLPFISCIHRRGVLQ